MAADAIEKGRYFSLYIFILIVYSAQSFFGRIGPGGTVQTSQFISQFEQFEPFLRIGRKWLIHLYLKT